MTGVSGTMNLPLRYFRSSLDMGLNASRRKSSVLSSSFVKQSFSPFGRFPDLSTSAGPSSSSICSPFDGLPFPTTPSTDYKCWPTEQIKQTNGIPQSLSPLTLPRSGVWQNCRHHQRRIHCLALNRRLAPRYLVTCQADDHPALLGTDCASSSPHPRIR